jgi:NADPH:quinone reductase-like Zn-dependent oxidoreductase
MAEYMTVEARSLAPKPARLGHDAAATIPMPGLTAWQGLFEHGGLEAGESVLVLGAAGGVGALAVQLARHSGARVLGLGRARDAEFIAGTGADVILSADGDLGSERVQLIFDTIGGTTLERAWDVLKDGGRVVSIAEPPSPERLAEHHATGSYFVVEPDRDGLRELAARIDAGTLNATVGITCTLDDGREKIIAKERGGFPGKLALTVA